MGVHNIVVVRTQLDVIVNHGGERNHDSKVVGEGVVHTHAQARIGMHARMLTCCECLSYLMLD